MLKLDDVGGNYMRFGYVIVSFGEVWIGYVMLTEVFTLGCQVWFGKVW